MLRHQKNIWKNEANKAQACKYEMCIKINNSGYFLIIISVKQAFVFTTPKICVKSLFATAITAGFLFFPFATCRSNNSLQVLFVSFVFCAHRFRVCRRVCCKCGCMLTSSAVVHYQQRFWLKKFCWVFACYLVLLNFYRAAVPRRTSNEFHSCSNTWS